MDDTLACPHCGGRIDMTECERYSRHTTYWGDDAVNSEECPHCEREFFIAERVIRRWLPARTAAEPRDAY